MFNAVMADIDRYRVSRLSALLPIRETVSKWFADTQSGADLLAEIDEVISTISALNPPEAPVVDRPIDKNTVMGSAIALNPDRGGWYCSLGDMSLAAFESYMFHMLRPDLKVLRFTHRDGTEIYRYPPGISQDMGYKIPKRRDDDV